MHTSGLLFAQMTVSGILLGCWPLLLNRSGYEGIVMPLLTNISNAALIGLFMIYAYAGLPVVSEKAALIILGIVIVLIIAVFAYDIPQAVAAFTGPVYFMLASLTCTLGLVLFLHGLLSLSEKEVGLAFLIMMVMQAMVPAVYHIARNFSDLSWVNMVGIGSSIVAVFALSYRSS